MSLTAKKSASSFDSRVVAYLASELPAISHTFIFREIQSLRQAGYDVVTASIRRPAATMVERMTVDEKEMVRQTCYIKETSLVRLLLVQILLFFRRPTGYLRMLFFALGLYGQSPRRLILPLAYFAEAGVLVDLLWRKRCSHVHVHFANPSATVAMIGASYGSFKYSMSVHGPDIFDDVRQNQLAMKVSHAAFVRCISYYCRSQLMRLVSPQFWQKLPIVHCGVDLSVYKPRPEPANGFVKLVCVGRLVSAKGQQILLESCRQLLDEGFKFKLTMVGDGPDRSQLEDTAKTLELGDSVVFTGAVGQDQVHAYYDEADIFVLPSFAEGVPVVLMEAMAKEIPVVTTCITGIPELITSGVEGLLVPPSCVEGLSRALKTLIQDGDLRCQMGQAGRRKVAAEFDLVRNTLLMANVFDNYVKNEE